MFSSEMHHLVSLVMVLYTVLAFMKMFSFMWSSLRYQLFASIIERRFLSNAKVYLVKFYTYYIPILAHVYIDIVAKCWLYSNAISTFCCWYSVIKWWVILYLSKHRIDVCECFYILKQGIHTLEFLIKRCSMWICFP